MGVLLDNAVEIDIKNKLLNKMRRTKGNRFNLSRRLEAKAELKSISINILSLLCILASTYILAYSEHISADFTRFLSVFITGVSILSLMLSLQSPVSDLARRANEAHSCAREISYIYAKLELSDLSVEDARKKYEEVLNNYKENHSDCDDWKTLYENKKHFSEDAQNIGWCKGVLFYMLSKYVTPVSSFISVIFLFFMWPIMEYSVNFMNYLSLSNAFIHCGTQN